MARRPVKQSPPTAGQRLVAELSQPDDPYQLRFLIDQAGHTADYLESLNALLKGDRDAWLKVKIGAKTMEVVVNNPLMESRQQMTVLSRLFTQIHTLRAAIPTGPDPDDDLAGLT